MKVRLRAVLVALLVSVLASVPFVHAAAALPVGDAGVVYANKADAKAAKEQARAAKEQIREDAEASKRRTECDASGVLPCAPTVTLTWVAILGSSQVCVAVVRVAGFAEGIYIASVAGLIDVSVVVGPDGTGVSAPTSANFVKGFSTSATVNGVVSAVSTVAC